MNEVVKKEIIKWLDVGIIYPIFDSVWVSPIQCVPNKGCMRVVNNERGINSYKNRYRLEDLYGL